MNLIKRIQGAWSALWCDGHLDAVEFPHRAGSLEAAGGLDVGAPVPSHLVWMRCGQLENRCATCPRLQAHRETMALIHELRQRELGMVPAVDVVKPDLRDGHREAAEVDALDQQDRRAAARHNGMADPHAQAHTVLDPVAPSVVQPQHSAQHGQRSGDDLNRVCTHGAIVAQGGAA
jgi:hypothetical protein